MVTEGLKYMKIRKFVYVALLATTVPFVLLVKDVELGDTLVALTALGSVAGFVGAVLLFWQLLLGLRFISTRFSKDLVWFNGLHQKLGTYGTLLVFAHPFLKAITYAGSIKFVFLADFKDPLWIEISYGRIAFFLLIIVWLTSVFFRKKLGFRAWKYIHFLAYGVLFFVFLHAPKIGTYLNTYPLLRGMWNVLSASFFLIVLYRLYKFLGFGYMEYRLVDKKQVEDVFVYTFEALGKGASPLPGQFCYIRRSRFFGEEHPFTVMESHPDKGKLVFGIKVEGKYTKRLSSLETGDVILIDGPFGVYTLEGQGLRPKVIISGGIGVTPFVDLVKKHGDENTYMFNANRKLDAAVRRDQLKGKLGKRYVDVISDEKVSGENIILGRLTGDLVRKYVPEEVLERAVYFICGSKPFYENYRNMLLGMNIPDSSIFYEEFGF